MAAAATAVPAQPVSLVADGLRSHKGQILICLTHSADHFPDCTKDPDKRHFTVPVRDGAIPLGMVPPGEYAIAIIHDENGNGKLDTFAGIPREGVGFSRNPVLRFGAPGFRSVVFPVAGAPVEQVVKLKYFL
ncbi:DUF2141 domain-containing protein [Sphingobium sp.]|uniref:DUF2141 domain-containing protein n=1 Tax=Sphingobium sp. TaxID=1912891 RepID=UPI003B3B8C61